MTIKIRPSKRPMALLCSSSVLEPEFPISSDNIYTRKGKATHQAIVSVLKHDISPEDAVEDVADEYGIDQHEVIELVHNAQKALAKISDHMPDGEILYEHTLSRGTPDWLLNSENQIVIIDWKSGMMETDAKEQLIDYADQAREKFGRKPVKAIAINLAVGSYWVHNIDQAEIDAMWKRDARIQGEAGKKYSPGSHCGYCEMRYECDARSRHALSCVNSLQESSSEDLSYGDLAELYPKVLFLEKIISEFRLLLRSAVIDAQSLPVPGGKELVMKDKKQVFIDPQKSWPILSARFSDDDMKSFVSIKKTKVMQAAKKSAPKGKGASTERALMKELEEADAISYSMQRSVSLVKSKVQK